MTDDVPAKMRRFKLWGYHSREMKYDDSMMSKIMQLVVLTERKNLISEVEIDRIYCPEYR